MQTQFNRIAIGATFTLSGIQYRKTSTITAESAFAVAIIGGTDMVTL